MIALQAIGVLSILPYPFVLLANIMSMAAPGRTTATTAFWALLSLYPLVWIALYVVAWRAMSRGAVTLALGLSSIPAVFTVAAVGVYLLSWVSFGLGMAGIGNGGLRSQTFPTNNPVIDSLILAGKDLEMRNDTARAVKRTLDTVDGNLKLVNVAIPPYGSPLNVALQGFSVPLDSVTTDDQQDRIHLIQGLVARGARLNAEEATDLRKAWLLRRALHRGLVRTSEENPLVWRIVTHDRGEPRPFNPFSDQLPRSAQPFTLKPGELSLLNRATEVHGTPLYAALLDDSQEVCRAIITAGGRLSVEEARDAAAVAALEKLFQRDASLRAAYNNTH
jgi:hypothetical protein